MNNVVASTLTTPLTLIVTLQHLVFGVCRLIDFVVPDVPQDLELKIKREQYLAKQALADSGAVTMVSPRFCLPQKARIFIFCQCTSTGLSTGLGSNSN